MRRLLIACVVVLAAVLVVVYTRRQPRGPALLNRATRAREVRPLSTQPDPRFAPLPLEREKHGR